VADGRVGNVMDDDVLDALRPYGGEGDRQKAWFNLPIPELLQALHHECPICGAPDFTAVGIDGEWTFVCQDGCPHDAVVGWLLVTDLRVNSQLGRAWVCLMLAKTPEQWWALLDGEGVNEEALDQGWLKTFRDAGVL